MERIAGIIKFVVDGIELSTEGSMTSNVGGFKREGKTSTNGSVVGFSEETIVPFIEGNIFLTSDLTAEKIKSMTNVTISFSRPTGKTVVFSEAFHAGEGDEDSENGTMEIRFEAKTAKEL